jgi:hypothetical protein
MSSPETNPVCTTQPVLIPLLVHAFALYDWFDGALAEPLKEILSAPAVAVDGVTPVIFGVSS